MADSRIRGRSEQSRPSPKQVLSQSSPHVGIQKPKRTDPQPPRFCCDALHVGSQGPTFKVVCNYRRRFECLFRRTQDQPRRNSKLHWKMWLVGYACEGRLRAGFAGELVRRAFAEASKQFEDLQLLSQTVGLL